MRVGDYASPTMVYEDITDIGSLKRLMAEKLEDYNDSPGVVRMDLVLFRDAIDHGRCHISSDQRSRYRIYC